MAPVFQAVGAQQNSTGTSVNVAWPTHLTNDIGLVVIETSGDSATLTPPAGWAAVPGTPVTDVATTAGSKLHVWWKRAASAAEGAVATGAATDHIVARLYTFRGCVTTGNPWNVTTTGTKTTASTTATVPSLTTTLDDTLITMIVGRPDDSTSITHFDVPVNAGLTGLAEAAEAGTNNGNGGGFVVSYGIDTIPGSTGTSTLTKAVSTTDTYVVLALKAPTELIATVGAFNDNGINVNLIKSSVLDVSVSKFFLPERNQQRWTEEFNNAAWGKSNASITANATTAPDGTLTADALIENTTQSVGHVATQSFTYVTGKTYTRSCYFKLYPGPITRYARLQLGSSTVFPGDTYININLTAGTIAATVGTGATSAITNEGNGWYRASITRQYTGSGVTSSPAVQIISTTGTALYTDADGLSGIYIWGVQFEEAAAVTAYDPTGAVGATDTALLRTHTIDGDLGKFFLPERNLVKFSEEFDNSAWIKVRSSITPNATISPDGLLRGDKVVEDTSNNTHILQLQNSVPAHTAGVTYTYSWHLKAGERTLLNVSFGSDLGTFNDQAFDINLSTGVISNVSPSGFVSTPTATSVGNGWYRVSATVVANSSTLPVVRGRPVVGGTTSYLGDGVSGYFIWGAQVEQGSTATDYDPTGPAGATTTGLLFNRNLIQQLGTFSVDGKDAILLNNRILDTSIGTYSLVGNLLDSNVQRAIVGTTGSFLLDGKNSLLQREARIDATTKTYDLAGTTTTLAFNRALVGQTGPFTIAGVQVDLTFISSGVAYTLDQQTGTFALAGSLLGLNKQFELLTQTGPYSLSGKTLGFIRALALHSVPGSFSVSGKDAVFSLTRSFNLTTGTYTVNYNNADVNRFYQLNNQLGTYQVVGSGLDYFSDRNLVTLPLNIITDFRSVGNFFWYQTTQTIQPVKYKITKRNEWILGRATHMGRRGL